MICLDNSEWMRNGDYAPNRFQAQCDAVNLVCGAKTQVFFPNLILKKCRLFDLGFLCLGIDFEWNWFLFIQG